MAVRFITPKLLNEDLWSFISVLREPCRHRRDMLQSMSINPHFPVCGCMYVFFLAPYNSKTTEAFTCLLEVYTVRNAYPLLRKTMQLIVLTQLVPLPLRLGYSQTWLTLQSGKASSSWRSGPAGRGWRSLRELCSTHAANTIDSVLSGICCSAVDRHLNLRKQ